MKRATPDHSNDEASDIEEEQKCPTKRIDEGAPVGSRLHPAKKGDPQYPDSSWSPKYSCSIIWDTISDSIITMFK